MLSVYVAPLDIAEDTVSFQWESNKEVPIFKKNNFYFRYEGINIENTSSKVHWNSFLSLMLPLLKQVNEQVVLTLPEAIPCDIVETWMNYHEVSNVKVFPLINEPSNLEEDRKNMQQDSSKIGILYGGGKDSSFTLSMLSEIYGIENIVLISYVFPMDKNATEKIDLRRDKFILEPLKNELGVKYQKIYTDFRATLVDQATANHVHTALYTGTAVPVIQEYNLSLVTYSYEFILYWTHYYKSEERKFGFKRSRPEFDDYISQRTNASFNTSFAIKNFNYFISETVAFKVLGQRYPYMLKYLLMCETTSDTNTKWCRKCHKCAEYALYSLCYQLEQKEIDYEDFFTNSPYIQRVLEKTENAPILEGEGNCQWDIAVVSIGHYQSFCHIIGSIDPEYVKGKVSQSAFDNFMKLKSRFGKRTYPIFEGIIQPAFEVLNPPKAKEIKQILLEHCSLVTEMPEYLLRGNAKIGIDYNARSEISTIFNSDFNSYEYLNEIAIGLVSGFEEGKCTGIPFELDNIQAGNIEKPEKEIELKSEQGKSGLEFYMDKSNPSRGDFIQWSQSVPTVSGKSYNIKLKVLSPYEDPKYKGRMKYYILLNDQLLIEEDIAMWNKKNEISIYTVSQLTDMKISVGIRSVRNCESWNWGYAGRIKISDFSVEECKNTPNIWVSCTSPYSVVSTEV